jgi:hypothetical protein
MYLILLYIEEMRSTFKILNYGMIPISLIWVLLSIQDKKKLKTLMFNKGFKLLTSLLIVV